MVVTTKAGFEACLAADAPISLPPRAYTDAANQMAEADAVFSMGWVGVGRADQIAETGDFRTVDIAGRPVILIRDKDGNANALANTCRHRGARLLDGEGNTKGIRCPFHAWAYRLNGELIAAPRMEVDTSCLNLHSYACEERHGFLFISFQDEPPSLDGQLGDFADIHAPWRLETLVTTRRWTKEFDCDWKAFIDVFNEYYHLPYVHRDSIDGVYNDPDPGDAVTGQYTTQFSSTIGTGGLLDGQQEAALPPLPGLDHRHANGVRYTWLFPNMTFAAGADGLWVYEAYPAGPGRCRVTQTMTVSPETIASPGFAEKIEAYHHRLDTALDEDIPALENQMNGLASPEARQGPVNAELEPNVANFARWYAGRMLEGTG